MAKHIKREYYTCDFCGEEITEKPWLQYPTYGYKLVEYRLFDGWKKKKDICCKCYERMRDYVLHVNEFPADKN